MPTELSAEEREKIVSLVRSSDDGLAQATETCRAPGLRGEALGL